MKFFTTSSSTSTRLSITAEDIRNYKILLLKMKGTKANAIAMQLITDETIYRLTIESATKAISALKKVIRRGQCHYKPGSNTDRLVSSFKKAYQEYKEMLLKMEIKMIPSKADYLIDCWLKKDAAEKAAQECRERKAMKKAAKKQALEEPDTQEPITEEPVTEDSYLKVPSPKPSEEITSVRVITEIIV